MLLRTRVLWRKSYSRMPTDEEAAKLADIWELSVRRKDAKPGEPMIRDAKHARELLAKRDGRKPTADEVTALLNHTNDDGVLEVTVEDLDDAFASGDVVCGIAALSSESSHWVVSYHRKWASSA